MPNSTMPASWGKAATYPPMSPEDEAEAIDDTRRDLFNRLLAALRAGDRRDAEQAILGLRNLGIALVALGPEGGWE